MYADDSALSLAPAGRYRLRERLRALAHERRRFGYRRLHVLLRREGTVNHKRLFRLYREEGLTVRRRGGRKRAMGTRAPMLVPQRPNQLWLLDFVADLLETAVACASWSWSTTAPANAWRSWSTPRSQVCGLPDELDRLVTERGKPEMIVSDNGTELDRKRHPAMGGRSPAWLGTTSRRASRMQNGFMPRASTAAAGRVA